MQLMLIFGIIFAIGAVTFALQNNVAVTVSVALWQFNGSLALVLLMALGIGVLITGLVSSPTVIRRQWVTARLRHQVTALEKEVAEQQKRNSELAAELTLKTPAADKVELSPVPEKSYVGLKSMLTGENNVK